MGEEQAKPSVGGVAAAAVDAVRPELDELRARVDDIEAQTLRLTRLVLPPQPLTERDLAHAKAVAATIGASGSGDDDLERDVDGWRKLAGEQERQLESNAASLNALEDERDAAIARAEAAEKRLAMVAAFLESPKFALGITPTSPEWSEAMAHATRLWSDRTKLAESCVAAEKRAELAELNHSEVFDSLDKCQRQLRELTAAAKSSNRLALWDVLDRQAREREGGQQGGNDVGRAVDAVDSGAVDRGVDVPSEVKPAEPRDGSTVVVQPDRSPEALDAYVASVLAKAPAEPREGLTAAEVVERVRNYEGPRDTRTWGLWITDAIALVEQYARKRSAGDHEVLFDSLRKYARELDVAQAECERLKRDVARLTCDKRDLLFRDGPPNARLRKAAQEFLREYTARPVRGTTVDETSQLIDARIDTLTQLAVELGKALAAAPEPAPDMRDWEAFRYAWLELWSTAPAYRRDYQWTAVRDACAKLGGARS